MTVPATCPHNPTTYEEGDTFGFYGVAAHGPKRTLRLCWDEREKAKVGSRIVRTTWLRHTFKTMKAASAEMYERNCSGPITPPASTELMGEAS